MTSQHHQSDHYGVSLSHIFSSTTHSLFDQTRNTNQVLTYINGRDMNMYINIYNSTPEINATTNDYQP